MIITIGNLIKARRAQDYTHKRKRRDKNSPNVNVTGATNHPRRGSYLVSETRFKNSPMTSPVSTSSGGRRALWVGLVGGGKNKGRTGAFVIKPKRQQRAFHPSEYSTLFYRFRRQFAPSRVCGSNGVTRGSRLWRCLGMDF